MSTLPSKWSEAQRNGAEQNEAPRLTLGSRTPSFPNLTIQLIMDKQQPIHLKDFFKQFKNKDGFHSFFNQLFKQGVEEMLRGERDEHLGYQKHSPEGRNKGNSRISSYKKTVKSDSLGEIVLDIPKDRDGQFSPQLVPKGQRMSDKLEDLIIGMYSRGMNNSDISQQVKDVYVVDVSEGTISNVTNLPTNAFTSSSVFGRTATRRFWACGSPRASRPPSG